MGVSCQVDISLANVLDFPFDNCKSISYYFIKKVIAQVLVLIVLIKY